MADLSHAVAVRAVCRCSSSSCCYDYSSSAAALLLYRTLRKRGELHTAVYRQSANLARLHIDTRKPGLSVSRNDTGQLISARDMLYDVPPWVRTCAWKGNAGRLPPSDNPGNHLQKLLLGYWKYSIYAPTFKGNAPVPSMLN